MNRDQCCWLIGRWCGVNRLTWGGQTVHFITEFSQCSLTLTLLRDKWNLFPALTVYVLWRVYIPAILFLTLADYETKQQSHEFISCLFIGRRCGNLSTCQIRGFGSERRVVKQIWLHCEWWIIWGLLYSWRLKTFRVQMAPHSPGQTN